MRKTSIFAIALLLAVCLSGTKAFAENITPQKAKNVATYFLSLVKGDKSIDDANAELAYQVINPDLNIAAAYVYNIGEQGYVIVSGTDCSTPIIGFSETGHINAENMPPAMKFWLEQYCEPIIDVQNAKAETPKSVAKEWDALINKTEQPYQNKSYIQLITDKWGQGENYTPTYNALCPQDNQGRYTLAGCVATALSMIMHYWEFPRVGKGNIYYPTAMADVNVDFAQAYYEYELMPEILSTSSSEAQINAVATLCYHVGAAVKMDYGINASGALSQEVVTALPKYFKYQKPSMIARSSFSDAKWIDTLRNEIENGRPIYYAARDLDPSHGQDAAGHAFICSGMRTVGEKLTFYINWGWDGSSNGFFDMETAATNFHPSGTQYNFNSDQRIIYRITPPADSLLAINTVMEDALQEAYPNPTTHSITIPHNVKNQMPLQIFNTEGRLMHTSTIRPSENAVTIDVSRYPKGIYFYRTNGKAHRFVVQ